MPKKCFFTIDFLIRSDTDLRKSISSVIDNEKFFIENIQLILIDSIGTELSTKLCAEYTSLYPDNVYFVDAVGQTTAEGYNNAMSLSFGTYISFMDNYGSYSKKSLRGIMEFLQDKSIPVFCCKPENSGGHSLVNGIENGTVRLHDTPHKFILTLGCYFYKTSFINGLLFDKSLLFNTETKFIIETLIRNHTYSYSDHYSYITARADETDRQRFEPQYSKNFYTRDVREFMIPMLRSFPNSAFIMSVMMYLIEVKFALNSDERYKCVLTGDGVKEFFDICAEAMKYIDDTVIMNSHICKRSGLDAEMPFRFMRLKYKNPQLYPVIDLVPPKVVESHKYYVADNRMEAIEMTGEFVAHVKKVMVTRSRKITADILAVNHDSGGIYIDGMLNGCSCLDEDSYTVYASVNGKRMDVIPSEAYSLKKFFDKPFLKRRHFRVYVPFGTGKKLDTVCFYFKYSGLAFRLSLTFSGINSRLSSLPIVSYAVFGGRTLTYDAKNKSLVLRKTTDSLIAVAETRFVASVGRKYGLASQLMCRRIRHSVRSLMHDKGKTRILVFYDENGINYNGNLLFRYFSKSRSESYIPYFITGHNSPEKTFLMDAGYDNILDAGSVKAKTAALAADYIFSSDCDPYEAIGFGSDEMDMYKDLMNAKVISVKNFFFTYKTAQFDNRLRDNTQYVFCTSEKEKQNLLRPVYDFHESMIRLVGSPILDAVNDKKEKLILFAPSERRSFAIYDNSSYSKFSESVFFKAYNDIISSPALLEACRRNGYKIILMLPNILDKYSGTFYTDDTVKLCQRTEQNEMSLVSRGAVLVTDYSELQFRFAYIGKPVYYFFPPGLPPSSEHPGEQLSSSGFGELILSGELLRERLIDGTEKGFEVLPKYIKRTDEFFPHRDKNNCKRIFDETIKLFRS